MCGHKKIDRIQTNCELEEICDIYLGKIIENWLCWFEHVKRKSMEALMMRIDYIFSALQTEKGRSRTLKITV